MSFARVLIVDDEPICQKIIQLALETKGFECDLAEDGLVAKEFLASRHYDVVVTDLLMPRLNGGELVISLCSQRLRPIIVVHTAILEAEVTEGLKREGVDCIILKPSDHAEMAKTILGLVETRRRRRSWLKGKKRTGHAATTIKSRQLLELCTDIDHWIQSRPHRIETFRFGILILACILFGLGLGSSLTPHMVGICRMFGLCGLAFYFCLELVAYLRDQRRAALVRYSTERRLVQDRSLSVKSATSTVDENSHPTVLA